MCSCVLSLVDSCTRRRGCSPFSFFLICGRWFSAYLFIVITSHRSRPLLSSNPVHTFFLFSQTWRHIIYTLKYKHTHYQLAHQRHSCLLLFLSLSHLCGLIDVVFHCSVVLLCNHTVASIPSLRPWHRLLQWISRPLIISSFDLTVQVFFSFTPLPLPQPCSCSWFRPCSCVNTNSEFLFLLLFNILWRALTQTHSDSFALQHRSLTGPCTSHHHSACPSPIEPTH